MNTQNSAIETPAVVLSPANPSSPARGLLFGAIGVLAFSFTLPFTRVAVETLDPLFVGAGRAVVAGLLAIAVLAITRQRFPRGMQIVRLLVIAAGVIAGFPLLTSFAMQTAPASHGAVVIGVLPAATALAAVIRAKERPSRLFWVTSVAGVIAAIAFVAISAGGLAGIHASDLLLLGAVALAAIGYAEGGMLSRELGSWQTICWALVLALPVMLPLTIVSATSHPVHAGPAGWLAFAYLGVISMFLGFFAWYRGLAIGPMANVSQIQLVQPLLTFAWAVLLFGENLDWRVLVGGIAIIALAATAVRARVRT
ncbi:DMT family transporter [Glaciihabitans sp. dw_435]|uniref:DMT family transporter n=1 Tax=Glaciihabitans sp. dw_435 TaxID=2720081 RepID=UPI001BD21ACC|nr:DMT family transporter [Glaciihabitans sp. dw_435]